MERSILLQPQPEELFNKYLENDVRADERKMGEMRDIQMKPGVISNAHGSARVSIGNTVLICGIKAELTKPSPEEPGRGLIIPNVELPPLCSPIYKSGAPCEKAQTATKFLDNLLKCTNIVDTEQLCITRDVLTWVLYADIICINYDGNLLDASVTAILLALANVKLPMVKVNEDEESDEITMDDTKTFQLNIKSLPISSSFATFDKYILRDPTRKEEAMTTGMVTYVVDEDDNIVYTEKNGGDMMTEKMSMSCIKRSRDHGGRVRKSLQQFNTTTTNDEQMNEDADEIYDMMKMNEDADGQR